MKLVAGIYAIAAFLRVCTLGEFLKIFFLSLEKAKVPVDELSLCSKNARIIFLIFEKSFPTNVIFGPRLPPILCFFVCSALLAQTTCLIPFSEDDP